MKRILAAIVVLLLLSGCSPGNSAMERAMALRSRLQTSEGCTFLVHVTADYGDKIYTFTMECNSDNCGNIRFTVKEPETISGISGQISEKGGDLTFDDKLLAFELLADGCVSPVSAPWLLMRSLVGGYISSCDATSDGLIMQIDDSYEEDPLKLDVWTDQQDLPIRADIMWQGRRIMAVDIKNFSFV